ncbi:hypothetical protein BH20CHL2_BH20CHL2_04580 [soil metagenome]
MGVHHLRRASLAAGTAVGERKEADVAGTLDRYRQRPLVLGACAKLAARLDLPSLTDMAPQPTQILVIDVLHVIDAKLAHLAAR